MARWSATVVPFTIANVADTTAMAAAGYMAVRQNTTAALRSNIWEVKLGGLATSSAPMSCVLARDSTISVGTMSGGKLAALDPATQNLAGTDTPTTGHTAATTNPSRSSTLYLLDLSFNAFGGLIRLQLPPEGPIGMSGITQPFGEVSISAISNGGVSVSAHVILETI